MSSEKKSITELGNPRKPHGEAGAEMLNGMNERHYAVTGWALDFLDIHENDRILDIGCGTGIQSLIASKLKAAKILAVDYDPEAVASTSKNAEANGAHNIEVKRNDLAKGLEFQADLIAANLTGPLILELCKNIKHVCKSGTVLIASGIIEEMETPCKEALQGAGFEILEIIRDDCLVAIASRFV